MGQNGEKDRGLPHGEFGSASGGDQWSFLRLNLGGRMINYEPKFIVSKHVDDSIAVKKTPSERWFSWPWRPWETHKRVYKPQIYRMHDTYLVSPSTYSLIVMGKFKQ